MMNIIIFLTFSNTWSLTYIQAIFLQIEDSYFNGKGNRNKIMKLFNFLPNILD